MSRAYNKGFPYIIVPWLRHAKGITFMYLVENSECFAIKKP